MLKYEDVLFEIHRAICEDYIKETKDKALQFLTHDDVFLCIMVHRFGAIKESMPEDRALLDAYYTALNYYFDRIDVPGENLDMIRKLEDYDTIAKAGASAILPQKNAQYQSLDKEQFEDMQLKQILLGIACGIDIHLYDNPVFTPEQMYEILLGQVEDLTWSEVKEYADPLFPAYLMAKIRDCKKKGIKCAQLFNPSLTPEDANVLYDCIIHDQPFENPLAD